jgi:hypothetical protein
MTFIEKLYAIIGKLGKGRTSERFEMTYPTFLSRLKNPGEWRANEIEIINRLYDETFGDK